MPKTISNTISLLGGAALGAVAMYLLDPDNGADRRHDVSDTATDAVAATGTAVRKTAAGASGSARSAAKSTGKYARGLAGRLGEHAEDGADAVKSGAAAVSGSASSIASKVAKYASDLIGKVGSRAHDAADVVSDHASDAADAVRSAHASTRKRVSKAAGSAASYGRGLFSSAKATGDEWLDDADEAATKAKSKGTGLLARAKSYGGDWADSAHDAADRLKAKGRKALGVPEPHPVATATGLTAGSLAVLVVGAGLMYYLDPERGRTRRAKLTDKVNSLTTQSGKKVRAYGHHLGNKATGYAAGVRSAVPSKWTNTADKVVSSVAGDPVDHDA